MVTKEEFKELKAKYWTEAYKGKIILITDFFPERLLILMPYRVSYYVYKKERHIAELNLLTRRINWYGINGDKIKGSYSRHSISSDSCIIIGDKAADEIRFFLGNGGGYLNSIWYDSLLRISDSNIVRLVGDLKSANIKFDGLYIAISGKCSEELVDIRTAFGISPKDLREIQEYTLRWSTSTITRAQRLKELFHTSIKDITQYLPFSDIFLPCWDRIESLSKEERKRIREQLNYALKLYGPDASTRNLYLYRDYLYMRGLLPESYKKDFSIFPSDCSRIEELHNQCAVIFEREKAKLEAAKLVERQQRYLDKFYKQAKAFELSDDDYTIIACKDLSDLVVEGRILRHCVGSYTESVSNGREYILFLRKNSDIDVPFFTIDVTPDKKVRQIHGSCNCNLSKEVKPFVEEWAKKFGLDISSCSGVYCALR